MKTLYKMFAKEPVLLGAAITVTADGAALLVGASTTTQTILHGITIGWVAWGVRVLSTPTSKVAARLEEAKYVGAMEHQALVALQPPPKPARARAAVKKAAAPARR